MMHGGTLLVCVLGGLALTTAGAVTPDTADTTDTADRPYQEIVTRNVFSLKPPPPPPNPEDNKPPPAKITLTGITTLVGKKALMKTPAPAIKPGTPPGTPPPTERFYMLGEGEGDGDIEVVAIDEKAGSVKVKNSGTEVTLTFEKDGVKLPTTAPPPGPAGVPAGFPAPGGLIPPPAIPGAYNPAATGVRPTFPVRPMRSPGQANATIPGMQPAAYPGVGASPNTVPLPSFNTPQNQAALSQAAMPDKIYTPEEQAIRIELNRAKSPFGALLPPTPLNRSNIEGNQPAPEVQPNQNLNPGRPPLPPGMN